MQRHCACNGCWREGVPASPAPLAAPAAVPHQPGPRRRLGRPVQACPGAKRSLTRARWAQWHLCSLVLPAALPRVLDARFRLPTTALCARPGASWLLLCCRIAPPLRALHSTGVLLLAVGKPCRNALRAPRCSLRACRTHSRRQDGGAACWEPKYQVSRSVRRGTGLPASFPLQRGPACSLSSRHLSTWSLRWACCVCVVSVLKPRRQPAHARCNAYLVAWERELSLPAAWPPRCARCAPGSAALPAAGRSPAPSLGPRLPSLSTCPEPCLDTAGTDLKRLPFAFAAFCLRRLAASHPPPLVVHRCASAALPAALMARLAPFPSHTHTHT